MAACPSQSGPGAGELPVVAGLRVRATGNGSAGDAGRKGGDQGAKVRQALPVSPQDGMLCPRKHQGSVVKMIICLRLMPQAQGFEILLDLFDGLLKTALHCFDVDKYHRKEAKAVSVYSCRNQISGDAPTERTGGL